MYEDEFEETLAADEADTLAGQRYYRRSVVVRRPTPPAQTYDNSAELRRMEAEMRAEEEKARAEQARMEAEMRAERKRLEAELRAEQLKTEAKARADEAKMERELAAEQRRMAIELAEQRRKVAERQRRVQEAVDRMNAVQSKIEATKRTENDETMKIHKTIEKIDRARGKIQLLDRQITEMIEHAQRMQQGV